MFITERLTQDFDLNNMFAGRVFQGESLQNSTQVKPFLVYRLGNDTSEQLSEEDVHPHRQFFLVYVHDVPYDYQKVDEGCSLVIRAFRGWTSAADNIMQVRYLETSRDLYDSVLDTVYRYVRFQLILGGG